VDRIRHRRLRFESVFIALGRAKFLIATFAHKRPVNERLSHWESAREPPPAYG
jgi:hypothetical protein